MSAIETYQSWLAQPNLPEDLRAQLQSIVDSPAEIEDRFYRDLAFGTGGLRGVLGAGTNRMNVITVRRATRGIADYLLHSNPAATQQGVVVGYDCRRMSRAFAVEVGCVLAQAGIRAYIFEHLCPTPELSFAVRHLGTAAGIMITASHNPPEYNGYKVYGPDGGQVLPDVANGMIEAIARTGDRFAIPTAVRADAEAKGLLQWIGAAVDKAYVQTVMAHGKLPMVSDAARAGLKIVYTPLHGTGYRPVMQVLADAGYASAVVVPSQAEPDGEFSTVRSPNPEEPDALAIAIEQAAAQGADLVMGTDPDADRVGIAVRSGSGDWVLLTGNQVGGLLVDFVLANRKQAGTLPQNGIVFKTIVTSGLGAAAAEQYGAHVEDTLTGFKYIGERISAYERTGEYEFLFGYEESYGYLAWPFVRDKDAVQISLLIAEMAAFYKAKGQTLTDALDSLYQRVGYYQEILLSRTVPGADGAARIGDLMTRLRDEGPGGQGTAISYVEDYLHSVRRYTGERADEVLTLPAENVLKFVFDDGTWMAVRPSGTEPKVKVYVGATGTSREQCEARVADLKRIAEQFLQTC